MATDQNNLERVEDNYLECSLYAGHTTSPAEGFTTFQAEDGLYYFTMISKTGKVILRSEGYPTTAARDNGLASVQKNREIRERFSILKTKSGESFVILKAGNHQEIARSCGYGSDAELYALFPFLVEGFKGNVSFDAFDAQASNRNIDEYLDCDAYAGHTDSPEKGFTIFKNEEGEHYFAVVDTTGKVLFRSEGYPTTAARDNGIQSVIRNRDNKDRYKIIEENGKYFVALRAGNNQEIARSCAFDSMPDIDALYFAPAVASSNKNIDEYLDCEAYSGHTESPEKGFTIFKSEEGEHYFAVVDASGKVLFRSEGYPTTAARDNGIQSVIKNCGNKDRYKVLEEDGKYFVALRAGNNQEIARSCAFDSEPNIDALYFAPIVAAALSSDRNIDQYLDCDAYKNHLESPHKDFVTFKEGDFYYFALLDGDGNVKLRSESYPTTAARDNGLQSVIKNKDIKERYKAIEEDGKHYIILRAGNNQEIARSCPQDSAAGLWAMFPYLAPLGALAIGSASAVASPKPVVVEEKSSFDPTALAAAAAVPVAAAALSDSKEAAPASYGNYEEEEKSGGGFKWWWLLPLLLLPLLWCMFNDCGCSKPKVAVPTVDTTVVAPKIDSVQTPPIDSVQATPPVAEPGCNCDVNQHTLFNVSAAPKSLHRLGSNPEYGWSHSLSPKQFHEKLSKRYKANAIDKEHLDGIAKAMGYANGFSDISPEMITEVKLPKGTVGNLGYSKKHKFGVYSLDMDKERDLEAFHFKSKNGCDVHIMKTCGNMMFFCNK